MNGCLITEDTMGNLPSNIAHSTKLLVQLYKSITRRETVMVIVPARVIVHRFRLITPSSSTKVSSMMDLE